MIRFENVGLRYGQGPEVLRDVSFHLETGSFHFVTGPSGAGKSTLLKMMYLALRPSRGVISLLGSDIARTSRRNLPAIRRRIGVVFQDFRLLDHLSVLENVALPLRISGEPELRVHGHATEMLQWVGLGDRLEVSPATLSGGEQQRVAICRAVVAQPSVIVADEPTGNVDDVIGHRLIGLFEELHRIGTTIIVATHNQTLVAPFDYPRLHLEDGYLATAAEAQSEATA